nr:cytosolic sulfotransferase 5-like [Tanacetum cinerariifolium]
MMTTEQEVQGEREREREKERETSKLLSSWHHPQTCRPSLENPDKILFLKYEEMKMQPEVELRKLAAFMGKPFTVEEEERWVVAKIVKLCSFEFLSSLEVNKNIMVSKNSGSSL